MFFEWYRLQQTAGTTCTMQSDFASYRRQCLSAENIAGVGCTRQRRLHIHFSGSANDMCCPVSAEAWWTSLKICSSGRSSSSARLLQRSVICSHCISSPVSRWSACGSCTQNIDSLCRTWNSGRGMSHSSANAQIYVTGQILPVKELWKTASIWRSHWQNYGAYLFGPPCIRCSVHFPVCVSVTGLQQHAECMDKFATVVVVLRWLRDNKNTSCCWGTARLGRASWNLVKYCKSVHDMQFIQWNQRNFTK